jgi:hypothetical protein
VIAKLAGVPVDGLTRAGRILLVTAPGRRRGRHLLARSLRDNDVKDLMHLSFQQVTGTVRATLRRPDRCAARRRRTLATIAVGPGP